MDEIRIEVKLKNNRLYNATAHVFGSVSEFCRKFNFSQSLVGALINLRKTPFSNSPNNLSEYTPTARKLADICGYSLDDLFPIDLYTKVTSKKIVRTMDMNRLLLYNERRQIVKGIEFEAINPYKLLEKKIVDNAINTLSEREKKVISERYGIGDGIVKTLNEVAKLCMVTRERVRQIEAKGIRKLRHPSRGFNA